MLDNAQVLLLVFLRKLSVDGQGQTRDPSLRRRRFSSPDYNDIICSKLFECWAVLAAGRRICRNEKSKRPSPLWFDRMILRTLVRHGSHYTTATCCSNWNFYFIMKLSHIQLPLLIHFTMWASI